MNQINWAEVDAVPEKNYNYAEAPEADEEFFKSSTLLMPDETKICDGNSDLSLQVIKQSLKGLKDIHNQNFSEFLMIKIIEPYK